jgi:hypothetical protein
MDERDGNLPLQQFLGKRWDHESLEKSMGMSAKERAQRQAEGSAELAQAHPNWSDQDIRTALSFAYLTMDLREAAVARRFTLDDPAELANGLAVTSRLRWIEMLIAGEPYVEFDYVLEAFAVHDLPAAHHLAAGIMPRISGDLGFLDLCPYAVVAAYRKDFAALRKVVQRMRKEKLQPWKEGLCTCLSGLAEQDAAVIAGGLTQYIDATRAMRMKDELADAIELRAHGLYRLCEWISPALVADVDVAQPLPWDAGFHAWCAAHLDPLTGVDLSGVSTVLHQAVVLLQPPAGWTAPSNQ